MSAPCACPDRGDLERLLLGDMLDIEVEILEGHVADCAHCLDVIRASAPEDTLVAAVRAGGKIGILPRDEVDTALIGRLCRLVPPASTGAASASAASPATTAELADLLAPAAAPDELGRIGPYGILRVLGAGGMGIVCAARQDRPRRVVALKMILADPRAGRQRLERSRSESDILARLRHPNIVQVYEVGEHAGRAYFTMEYADGGSLAAKLAAAPLPARAAAELTRTLAATVHAAHAQGIVHRDLKPSNVLLAADGTPWIADFGLAKKLPGDADATAAEQTATGVILGTPGYMAPEQAAGNSQDIGPAADVYALGAILYECLTGRPPFKAATVLETLEQVRNQEPVPPGRLQPRLPRDLQTICLKCLAKEPQRRYASAAVLADDLDRFAQGKPIVARPVRAWERAWKWARRRPTAAALVAVCVGSLAALILGVLWHNAQLQEAVNQAQTNAAEAERQQQRAHAYYRRSRDTLEQILEQLDSYRLGEVPQLKELQRRQLEKALAFYQDALKEQDDPDPAIRLDTAFACQRTADIQALFGRREAAADNYRRAVALVDSLPPDVRDGTRARMVLMHCRNRQGDQATAARNWDEAEMHHRAELAIADALLHAAPNDSVARANRATVEFFLAVVAQRRGAVADAERHYELAVRRIEALRADRPEHEGYQGKLAECHINLGLIYQNSGRPDAATLAYGKAEATLQALRARHPSAGEYALTLAALYANWAQLRASDDLPADLARHTKAVDLIEQVLKQEPEHHHARQIGFNAYGARAQFYESAGRWADAVRDWDRVLALDDQPNPWARRVLRAAALARAGDHARAAAEAQVLSDDPQVSADGRYNLACVYALAAGKARTDAKLADRYAGQAMTLLRQLHAQDYFRDQRHAKTLATDLDLLSLRSRPDFKHLSSGIGPRD